jgi:hypothetical protein
MLKISGIYRKIDFNLDLERMMQVIFLYFRSIRHILKESNIWNNREFLQPKIPIPLWCKIMWHIAWITPYTVIKTGIGFGCCLAMIISWGL